MGLFDKVKKNLDKKVQDRPAKKDLVDKGVLKGDNVAPALAATQDQLAKLQVKDQMNKKYEETHAEGGEKRSRPESMSGETPDAKRANFGAGGKLFVRIIEGKNLGKGKVKPFCLVEFEHNQIITPCGEGQNPAWKARIHFDVTDPDGELTILVYDKATAKGEGTHEFMGMIRIRPSYADEKMHDNWFKLKSLQYSDKVDGEIHLQLAYKKVDKNKKLTIDDFDLLKVIGKGSFGKVMMVRKKDTSRLYAMKILKKNHIVERDEVTHTKSERHILAKNTNPFLVGLKFSFQTQQKIYLVLDFINGGELFFHLQNEGRFSIERSRFYAAQLLLAMEHLHKLDIVYRDLKPENILVDYNGYIALTDFGLCKEDVKHDEKTNTFCGTPEYMAPEVLQQKGYGPAVDWWTLGILMYEMMTGLPPFYDENTNTMYQKILFSELTFPDYIPDKARVCMTGLLQRDPDKRLGSGPEGAFDIKNHPFFKDVQWADLLAKKIKPPWKPHLSSETDTRNFDVEFTELAATDSLVTAAPISGTMQEQFQGFTYVDDNEMMKEENEAMGD